MTTIEQLKLAKDATNILRLATTEQKNNFLHKLSDLLLQNISEILVENKKDLDAAVDITKPMKKRLELTEQGIGAIAKGVREVVGQEDPVGKIVNTWKRPNGLTIGKMRVPIGVIVFVFESRPNVIVDAAALCVKSGNVLIARGGKEAQNSNNILEKIIQEALESVGLPKEAVQQLEDRDYSALTEVVQSYKYVDLVVPRGRAKMIKAIKDAARVPVIAHERGLCHLYIDKAADKKKAIDISINAKVSNPSVCNSIETILVHKDATDKILPDLISKFIENGVEVRGDERVCSYSNKCVKATEEDWNTEYLDLIISIKVVDSYKEAVEHITRYSSGLTDSIVTEDKNLGDKFLRDINSASVLVNASNRLTDGGVFGLGAELGISTASIHMKGPMGIEDLTVTKYIVVGDGQIRE